MLPAQLEEKIIPEPNTGCWLWVGAINSGYGITYWRGLNRRAHRVVYELLVGCIPAGLDIDHKCRMRCCVNPDHLEPVTRSENLRRSPLMGKGLIGRRFRRGKDVCARGHAVDGVNVLTDSRGTRRCAICRREQIRRAHRKMAAANGAKA